MSRIEIQINDHAAIAGLNALIARGSDISPLMAMLGEKLADSTKERFATSTAPDGSPWAPNAHQVIRQLLDRNKRSFSKRTGALTKTGNRIAAGKKPLIGETRALSTTIHYQLLGRDTVVIGSGMEYAATQQFGAKKGAFGKTRRNGPIPWGDIPARPFLGISAQDERTITSVINEYLAAPWD